MLEALNEAKIYQLTGCAEDWITTHLKGFWGLRTDQTYQWMAINEGDYCLFHATRPEWAKVNDPEPPEGIIGMGKVAKKSNKTSLEWISEIQAHVSSRPLLIHFSEMWWIGDVDKITDEGIKEKLAQGDERIVGDIRTLTENAITVEGLESDDVSYAPAKSISEMKSGREALLEVLVSRLASSRYGIDWNQQDSFFAVWAYDMLDQESQIDRGRLFRRVADIIGQSPEAVERKVQNVAFHDPQAEGEKPIAEAANRQTLLARVFNWYWKDRRAARERFDQLYQAAIFGLNRDVIADKQQSGTHRQMIVEESTPGQESLVQKEITVALLEQGRGHFRALNADGKLRCAACDFASPDGDSLEIVQLHHLEPIWAEDEKGTEVRLEDVLNRTVPLCPTCHALAHTQKPPLTVEGIKDLLGME